MITKAPFRGGRRFLKDSLLYFSWESYYNEDSKDLFRNWKVAHMIKILTLAAVCIALAWVSEQNTAHLRARRSRVFLREDLAFWLLLAALTLFAGLRTQFNDTQNYFGIFQRNGNLQTFFADPKNLNPLGNPLFYFLLACLRQFTDNGQVMVFLSALYSQFCFLLFFRRYSRQFTFTVFLYFTLGTFVFSLAAIKQVLAMATLTLAMPALEQRQWGKYLLIVLVAALFHTYAIAFAALPLFRLRPWSSFTFIFVGATVFVLVNFQTVIGEFLEYANNAGKPVAEYEVMDKHTVNLFRVAVYAVPPVLSLLYARWINWEAAPVEHVFVHMSIISLAFMTMGTQAGANMFARMATYFELGTLVCLPAMLEKTFDKNSLRIISTVTILCFCAYFLYANQNFDSVFKGLGILGLF